MSIVLGVLMAAAGLALVVIAVMGTQGQVFAMLTGHAAPSPANPGGGSPLPSTAIPPQYNSGGPGTNPSSPSYPQTPFGPAMIG